MPSSLIRPRIRRHDLRVGAKDWMGWSRSDIVTSLHHSELQKFSWRCSRWYWSSPPTVDNCVSWSSTSTSHTAAAAYHEEWLSFCLRTPDTGAKGKSLAQRVSNIDLEWNIAYCRKRDSLPYQTLEVMIEVDRRGGYRRAVTSMAYIFITIAKTITLKWHSHSRNSWYVVNRTPPICAKASRASSHVIRPHRWVSQSPSATSGRNASCLPFHRLDAYPMPLYDQKDWPFAPGVHRRSDLSRYVRLPGGSPILSRCQSFGWPSRQS